MKDSFSYCMSQLFRRVVAIALTTCIFSFVGVNSAAIAIPLPNTQPVVAYNIDFGMDLARAERTIEHYGEEIREIVEQTLRNNENHPESKDTAKNSYRRETTLNTILPEKRSSAFSPSDLAKLKQTEHPRDRLK